MNPPERSPGVSLLGEEPAPSTGDDASSSVLNSARFPDNFYTGLIIFLDRVRGRGIVRSDSGREIKFEFPFVRVVDAPIGGRAPGIDRLNEGDSVGFDVGWTSKGLRATVLKPVG